MKRFLLTGLLFVAVQCHALLDIYAVGSLGFMGRSTAEKMVFNLEKYSIGIGVQINPLSFLSIGTELEYTRGDASDPKPANMAHIAAESYGGYKDRGVNYVKVNYFEWWIRPKLILPIPFVQPYLVIPVSPMSVGGMQGYSVYGAGFGALAGIQTSIMSLSLFLESGALMRTRKGDGKETPPWGMFDIDVPIRLGVGYSF